jgi:hypothetical protein
VRSTGVRLSKVSVFTLVVRNISDFTSLEAYGSRNTLVPRRQREVTRSALIVNQKKHVTIDLSKKVNGSQSG